MRKTRRDRRSRSRRRTRRLRHRGGTPTTPTFHILITASGRPSLKNLLASMKNELSERDAVTIVFDGKDKKAAAGWSDVWIKDFKAPIALFEEEHVGNWGHDHRTAYQTKLKPQTTFIMHADDDDQYIPGFAHGLRETCIDPNKLYIARMTYKSDRSHTVPRQSEVIKQDDIGSPCGIIPWAEAGKGVWENQYTGDFKYYEKLGAALGKDRISFIPNVIYLVSK